MSVLQKVAIDINHGSRPINSSVFNRQKIRKIQDLYSKVWQSRSGKISIIQLAMYGTTPFAEQLDKFAKLSKHESFDTVAGAQVFKEKYYGILSLAINRVVSELRRLSIPEQDISPFGPDQLSKILAKFNATGDRFISAYQAVMYVDNLRSQDTVSTGKGTYNAPSYLEDMKTKPDDRKTKKFKEKEIESDVFPKIKKGADFFIPELCDDYGRVSEMELMMSIDKSAIDKFKQRAENVEPDSPQMRFLQEDICTWLEKTWAIVDKELKRLKVPQEQFSLWERKDLNTIKTSIRRVHEVEQLMPTLYGRNRIMNKVWQPQPGSIFGNNEVTTEEFKQMPITNGLLNRIGIVNGEDLYRSEFLDENRNIEEWSLLRKVYADDISRFSSEIQSMPVNSKGERKFEDEAQKQYFQDKLIQWANKKWRELTKVLEDVKVPTYDVHWWRESDLARLAQNIRKWNDPVHSLSVATTGQTMGRKVASVQNNYRISMKRLATRIG